MSEVPKKKPSKKAAKGAPVGNKFWRLRNDMSKDGRKISVANFKIKCQEYIDRCLEDALLEVDYRGKDAEKVLLPKMRCMSIWGCCVHIGIVSSTWDEYRKDDKYSGIVSRVEDIFKAYNIEAACAGMMKENAILRIENIKDRKEIEMIGKQEVANMFPDDDEIISK